MNAGAAIVTEDTVEGHGAGALADGSVPDQLSEDEDASLRLHYEMRLQVRQNRSAYFSFSH